jgi:pectate lyase
MSERAHTHRRRPGKRRMAAALTAALGLTGAALATNVMLQPAGAAPAAAPAWPSATGTQAVSKTIAVSGTYDGSLKRFYGSGDTDAVISAATVRTRARTRSSSWPTERR